MEKSVVNPDLAILLQSDTDRLLENIKKRDRAYEQEINWKYLDALNQIYNEFFMKYDKSPLIIIYTNDIDFVNNPKDLDEIINFIRIPTKGTRYFNPMKSL